jgi:glycosyltransferase involved in cell wall biosynthesis
MTSPNPVRPRRVLFVINGLGAGGGESHMVYLAAGLADLGYDVTVAGLRPVRRDIAPLHRAGVRVLIFRAEGPAAKLRRLPLLIRLARRADVVCASLFDATLYGRLAAILARRPVVIIEHAGGRELAASRKGKPRAKWVALHNRLLDPFTYAVVAVARWQLQILSREGVDESKIHVIHNGVAAEDLSRQADAGVSRTDLGIPDAAKVLIHVARFIPQKNQRATLEVVRRLRTDLGDVHVIFAGEGDLLPDIQAQAEAMGAGAWAHFVGRRRDVPRLLRLADVFVLPSFAEAMPVAILEALAVGIPVVATDVADIRPVLELTGGGLLIPPGDDDAFERACRRLFTEPGLHSRLASEGLNGVRLHFDYRPMVRNYATVLDAAVASAPLDTAA